MYKRTIHILTLFPEVFPSTLDASIIGKAIASGAVNLKVHDLKQFQHQGLIDDTPYGGGCGMVIKCEVVDAAIETLGLQQTHKFYTSPRGCKFSQPLAAAISKIPHDMLFLCGRYEGVDQRVLDAWDFNPISLGDFVLCGGEVAVLAMLEACIRLLPGVVGKEESLEKESFQDGLLEHDHFTKPAVWTKNNINYEVPDVLLSGDHGKISAFRNAQSKQLTYERRRDLWEEYVSQNVIMEEGKKD